jgi:hypothetical protein
MERVGGFEPANAATDIESCDYSDHTSNEPSPLFRRLC